MSRLIAVVAWGFMLAACSATMPNLNLDFMKSAPQAETLAIESEPPGAEAKTSLGQSCLTPCQLSVQPGSEFSVMLALRGYQPQTVSVRPEHVDLQAVTPKKPIAKRHPVLRLLLPRRPQPRKGHHPRPTIPGRRDSSDWQPSSRRRHLFWVIRVQPTKSQPSKIVFANRERNLDWLATGN